MAIAELKAIATLDGKQFDAEIKKVGASTGGFASKISGLKGLIAGAFGAGAIIGFSRNLLGVADQMQNIAVATNLSMGQLTALKAVAAENNVSMEMLSTVLGKVRDAQGQAVALTPAMIDALKVLGISAEAFVGAGTDEALALISKGFVDAGGSAEAFSAVQDILGKASKGTIEMLTALNNEGLAKLSERTKEAAAGFEALAQAQSNIEKFFSAIQIGAGKAIGKVMALGEEMGRLSVAQDEAGKSRGFLSTMFEAAGNLFYKGKFDEDILGEKTKAGIAAREKAAEPIKTAASDVVKLRENQRKAAEKADFERLDKEIKANNEATRRDERRMAKEEDFNREQDKIAEDFTEKRKDILAGKGIEVPERARVDALQAIGGLIGGVAGRGDQAARIAERTAKASEAMEKLVQDTNRKIDELNRKLDGIID